MNRFKRRMFRRPMKKGRAMVKMRKQKMTLRKKMIAMGKNMVPRKMTKTIAVLSCIFNLETRMQTHHSKSSTN